MERKNARTTRGRPFAEGNSGRPRGSLNRATVAAQTLLDGEVETLTRKAVELALEGHMAALRLCLERIIPPRKERAVAIKLPSIKGAQDLPRLTAAILKAVGQGELDTAQAASLASLVAAHGRTLELAELEQRISALEGK